MRFISRAALAAALPIFPAAAQPASPPKAADTAPERSGSAAKAHPDSDQAIVVTGTRRPAGDVLGNAAVLNEEELAHDLKPSLGDTLKDLPGVSSTSFGPSASRPILRGEQGDRAPVLIDGISTLDLSATDPDHAVTINPITAQSIEVLHGPGALLYTGSAIGGVVNVIDRRIPRSVPKETDGDVLLNYGSAANERSANGGVDVPLGGNFVAHADGSYSKYDNLHIGGYLLTDELRRQALASPDPNIRARAGLRDTLPNTAGRTDDLAAGLAYASGDLDVGFAISRHEAKYGVPIRWSLDPAVEPERPTIDARQDRGDVRVNVPIGGFLKLFEFRGGISKYHHDELDAQGAIGSSFFSNGGEARAQFVQAEGGGWGGTTGLDYLSQDARIRGEEKYLPDSRKQNLALFTLQTVERGAVRFEGGLRLESTKLNAKPDARIAELAHEFGDESGEQFEIGSAPVSRRFTPLSASLGANYEVVRDWRLGLSLSHSERSPSIDELFSFGPHGGSQQFLIGMPALGIEKSNGMELSLHRTTGQVHLQGSLYYSRFSNFVYQAPTGGFEDGLPIYEYRQGKALYYGFEAESDVKFGKALGFDWSGEGTADATRAKVRHFGNAPEIPAFRVLAGVTATRGQVDGRLEVERVAAQRKVAPNETTTRGYTLVNASLDWHPLAARPELTLSATGSNLFNVNARAATSELKDYAPLAGRDIRLTARIGF